MKYVTFTYLAITIAALTLGACANVNSNIVPSSDVATDASPTYFHSSDPRWNKTILNAGGQ